MCGAEHWNKRRSMSINGPTGKPRDERERGREDAMAEGLTIGELAVWDEDGGSGSEMGGVRALGWKEDGGAIVSGWRCGVRRR